MIHESDLCDLCYQFTRTVTELKNFPNFVFVVYELIFYVVAYLISHLTSDLSVEVRAKSFSLNFSRNRLTRTHLVKLGNKSS